MFDFVLKRTKDRQTETSHLTQRSFLADCAAGGTTVVMTTHFMEEADKADRIGFMRGGRILVEGAPAKVRVIACMTSALGATRINNVNS